MTLTSLGLVRRSVPPGEEEPRQIALWKEPGENTQELKLPRGSHALLLTVNHEWQTNYTMDGRSDDGNTVDLSLTGIRHVAHPRPPSWAE